ncbi:hypothetical protein NLX83_12235 [Allokutzneria sp. A3M-2-11 16]|uniref:hypothetical protein n=1 Tax=Allokutzneria sp. A3M-2-11 16 TaxID=2962043 RepID=UPI0020B82700|nr:hypothetical protein [Allokutzneria sp. A3M-2-11 16]MCP3800025.1 hypothetical protein [Allokutzneria sp. A3M-2-11 16]
MSISAKLLAAIAVSGAVLLGASPAFAAPVSGTTASTGIVFDSATVVSVSAGKLSLKLSSGASASVKLSSATKITGKLVAGVKVKVLCVKVDGSLVANTVIVL